MVAHIFTLLLAPFASKLVNCSKTHHASKKLPIWTQKMPKRSENMCAINFYLIISRNILLYMNVERWSVKISISTYLRYTLDGFFMVGSVLQSYLLKRYEAPWIHVIEAICNFLILGFSWRPSWASVLQPLLWRNWRSTQRLYQ